MKVKEKDGNLVIEIPMEKPRLSSTGKNLLVATSRGPKVTKVIVNGKPVSVVINAFIAPDAAGKISATKAGAKGEKASKPQADSDSDSADDDDDDE